MKIAGLQTTFRSLRFRNYRLFFMGQSISLIGTWMQRIALPWLVYSMTNSAFLLGLVGFASQIPTFLLAPFAGVLIDRWNRYTILIVTQILAMVQSFILTYLFFTHSVEVWQIIVLSIFLGLINAFDMPARQTFTVDLIENREDLGNAIALNSSMFNAARLLGPSVAGVLIALTGEGVCFLINGISYLFVLAFLLMIKIKKEEEKVQHKHIWHGIKEGFTYTFGFKPIGYIILLLALVSLMGMQYAVLIPVFAKNILHGGPNTFGFLIGASGIGALSAAIYMASRKSVLGLGKMVPMFAAFFGAGLILFAMSRLFALSVILMAVTGFGMIMQMTSSNTILQTVVDDDKRGRVMSFYTMAFMGTAPFGSLMAGTLADYIGAPYTLIIGGAFCILGAIIFARKLPELKKMVRPVYIEKGILPEMAAGIQSATELTSPPED